MVRPPKISRAVARRDGEVNQGPKGSCSTRRNFHYFGKSIDESKTEVLAETLSLIGKLFEIYFVRLIGTPNQNSKNGLSFG